VGTPGEGSRVSALSPSESDIAAIREAELALAASFEADDHTAWVDHYTDDAVFAGPGGVTIEGRAALLAAAENFSITSMEIAPASTIGGGDFVATYGRASWLSGPDDSGAERTRRRFLMVWRREAGGRWRIAREVLTDD
jgi:ketosteroid isomerase-like protein